MYQSASNYWQSITTAEKICMEEGTRLAAPDQASEYSAVHSWLYQYMPYMEASGDTSFLKTWFGYRKIDQSFKGMVGFSVVSPWYHSSASIAISGSVANDFSSNFPSDCTLQDNNNRQGYSCLNSDTSDVRALCEYRHCTTLSGKYCTFPFKIGNRQYDTCVPFGRADGSSWCATSTDAFGNILTNETCNAVCPVSPCPVGFTSVLETCIHISAAHPYDTVQSVQEAEDICMSMGARLYQPRSITSLRTLLFMNQALFNKNASISNAASNDLLGYDSYDDNLALGINGTSPYTLTYRDGSPFPEKLIEATQFGYAWAPGYPNNMDINSCIVLKNKQEFANVPCAGYSAGTAPGEKLSYICEARPLVTTDGLDPNKSCVFPFKTDASDVWHHSCIYAANAKVRL
jgi:Fibronectin type II domain